MSIKTDLEKIAKSAQQASRLLVDISRQKKDKALLSMAKALRANAKMLIRANKKDISSAKRRGRNAAFLDRLVLNNKRIEQMAASLENIARLADPVGKTISTRRRPNGLLIKKVRVPIGVVAIIYEARPNVTSDCIGLCLKSGNAVILRGGSESINSNAAIYNLLKRMLKRHKLPQGAISLIRNVDRKAVDTLLALDEYIDLVIPRGGEGLIRRVAKKSKIAVIKHYKGICHAYVDSDADLALAHKICINAKVQRPGVCNAMETLLVNKQIARKFLPLIIKDLQAMGVEIRADAATRKIVSKVKAAKDKDWTTEYLDLILSIKVVNSLDEAIKHINNYGSGHSDAIITKNRQRAKEFLTKVDSACVYVNASTRFTDGYEFGLGAEMGISTDKLHARGPMALEELTTYKYEVFGKGQIRT